jgi:hypothetical protein
VIAGGDLTRQDSGSHTEIYIEPKANAVGLSYGSSTASNPRQNIYALTFGFGVGVAQFEIPHTCAKRGSANAFASRCFS